jgi:hypothetical protein
MGRLIPGNNTPLRIAITGRGFDMSPTVVIPGPANNLPERAANRGHRQPGTDRRSFATRRPGWSSKEIERVPHACPEQEKVALPMTKASILLLVLALVGCRDTLVVPDRPGKTSLPRRAGLPGVATRPLASPPSYLGTQHNGGGCTTTYPTVGFEPADGAAKRPLFLYFIGTTLDGDDPAAAFDSLAARTVTEAMARRGFVALSVAYDNGIVALISSKDNQLHCLFEAPTSVLARACMLPQVDCNLGIATWGHSQGAAVAMAAANFDPRVRGVWTTGYGGNMDSKISKRRVRVVNGEHDQTSKLDKTTGIAPEACPGQDACLRDDGSGWIIVRKAQLADPASSTADHCWFDRRSCKSKEISLEPTWIDPDSKAPYALESNADGLAATVKRTDLL